MGARWQKKAGIWLAVLGLALATGAWAGWARAAVAGAGGGPTLLAQAQRCPAGFRLQCRCVPAAPAPGTRPNCIGGRTWNPASKRCEFKCPGPLRWDNRQKRCLPRCDPNRGLVWNPKARRCVTKCRGNTFWFQEKRLCLNRCPNGWWWAPDLRRCAKRPPRGHRCPNGWSWNGNQNRCTRPGHPGCKPGQFFSFHQNKCLGGPPRPMCPPSWAYSRFWDQCVGLR